MSNGMYIAMNGAAARAEQLDAVADNLANIQTPGFKATRPAFQVVMPLGSGGDQAHPVAVANGVDMRPGILTSTNNPLDVTPEGNLFFAVKGGPNGVAFTRNGRLEVDTSGVLKAAGLPVMGQDGNPITAPLGVPPEIDSQGRIMVDGTEVNRIPLYRLDGTVNRAGPSLFVPGPGGKATPTDGKVQVGTLEMGNASALEASVEMISAQRNYETSLQALQTYRRLDDRATDIGRVR